MRGVHTQDGATGRATPLFNFVQDKICEPIGLDVFQVGQRTGCVSGPIAFVQMAQACAREFVTVETKRHVFVCAFSAVFDLAVHAGSRLEFIVSPTTATGLLLPGIGTAKTAIDATWGDQYCAEWACS